LVGKILKALLEVFADKPVISLAAMKVLHKKKNIYISLDISNKAVKDLY